jgi:hypothetical protein
VLRVEVPSQDLNPAQLAIERLDLQISGWLMAVGGLITIAAIAWGALSLAARWFRRSLFPPP